MTQGESNERMEKGRCKMHRKPKNQQKSTVSVIRKQFPFSIFNLSLKGGHTTIAPNCSATHSGMNSMNERVPAQKGRKWCGMQPGTLTLWYAISLCSPVHDAKQVPRFYKDFCKVTNDWCFQSPKTRMNLYLQLSSAF